MSEFEIYWEALNRWGAEMQTMIFFEKVAELEIELCRFDQGSRNTDAIAEEIADVYIMLDQIILIHGCQQQIAHWIERKSGREEKWSYEAMAGLQKELCKFARGKKNKDAIAEKIADLEIVLNLLVFQHCIMEQVAQWKERKLDRLKERLFGEMEG